MSQSRADVVDLLERHGVSPRKRYGQHFLADRNLVDKIVRLAGDPAGRRALEIGAGTGTLTGALADAGFDVLAYEVDEGLRSILEEALDGRSATLRIADAMEIDPEELTGRWVLVGNLPYNVGTPILLDLIRAAGSIERFVVMVQREVADRLVASPGDDAYGLPSVVVQLYGSGERSFTVPPQVFVPAPNVDSAVIAIDRVHAPDSIRDRAVEIASAGFSQRRKMLRSSLRSVLTDTEERLTKLGIDPTARAETLTADEFLAIARSEES